MLPAYDNPVVQSWFESFLRDKLAMKKSVHRREIGNVYDFHKGIGQRTFESWKREFERKVLLSSHGVMAYRDPAKQLRYGGTLVGLSKLRRQNILSMLSHFREIDKRQDGVADERKGWKK